MRQPLMLAVFGALWAARANCQLPDCPYVCTCMDTRVECKGQNMRRVPDNLNRVVTKLDLSVNNISQLPDFVFSRYHYLEELNLANNGIEYLTAEVFSGLDKLRELSLQDNNLSSVPAEALKSLKELETLRLDGNMISEVPASSLANLSHVTKLWLGNNLLSHVPTEALALLLHLEALDLSGNEIVEIPANAFYNLSQLVILALQNNRIMKLDPDAFNGLFNLKILELNNNHLTTIPSALRRLPTLEQLTVAYNDISFIEDGSFKHNLHLVIMEMKKNPLQSVGHYAFTNMTKLKKLMISEAKQLNEFPDLNGTSSLEILRIDRSKLRHVPNDLCKILKKLKSLDLKSNNIQEIPNLDECRDLRLLDMTNNQVRFLHGKTFHHQTNLHDLLLGDNQVREIDAETFTGLEKLQILDLVHNKIEKIHDDAFLPLKQLEDLNLGNNFFPELPSKGLENVRHIKTFNNKFLKEFPPPSSFPRVQTLALSYAYHCCEFLPLSDQSTSQPMDINEVIIWPPKDKLPDLSLWNSNNSDIWPGYENLTARFGEFADEIWGNFGPDYTYPSNLPQQIEEYFEDYKAPQISANDHIGKNIFHCIPQPGPFMPCEDLFDWWTLRCGVWIVFLLAMLGNGAVVFVLVFSRSKMDVPRFLVCNLALADFFMGVYLGFLAVVDASTLGEFKMHAIKWQTSAGCQVAGFLGVLSSELSVYTLAVITLERNYAITHAMHLNKRLSLRHASYIMGCGWAFALIVAALPLFGISDYRKFAICLPFETEDSGWSLAYVVFLMSVNGFAFLILMGCYLKMYCSIRGSQAWNSNDSRIAKRMALLVFTDFICWAPIAFFSLTAAFGLQLISLEEAKVFTVFVLPLNSCANPFLYAILTKQFKKDCVLICKAIEESRVTRGIGRCRHSSNFSNRHTPGNTNSAVERNSSNNGQVCNCHLKSPSGLNDGDVKPVRKSWRFSKVRYLLCDAGEPEQDSTNEYAYALAEIQRNQHKQHKRHSSVSSENFSSSRSDSWKNQQRGATGHGPAARLLEKRRRNSWTITRKPSQDSNLSNSRNDSSATTASTSTWRVSRSSVSSDGSAPRGTRDKQQVSSSAPPSEQPANSLQTTRFGSVRDKQQTGVTPLQSPTARNSGLPLHPVRPKLQRQSAISDDNWQGRTGSIDSQTDIATPTNDETMSCFYNKLAEIILDDSSSGSKEDQGQVTPQIEELDSGGTTPTRYGLCVAGGFIPRKLSTISSRSCSVNHEVMTPSTEDNVDQLQAVPMTPRHSRSHSLLVIPTEPLLIPRRFASDDALQTPPAVPKDPGIAEGDLAGPSIAVPLTRTTAFSFEDPDDDVFEDGVLDGLSKVQEQNSLLQGVHIGHQLEEPKENQPLIHDRTKEPT